MLTVKHYKEKVKILEKFFLQFMKNVFAVSYTHLTLPTILRV